MGQEEAIASLIPATALGMKTALTRCVTEMDVIVLLSLVMLLGDMLLGQSGGCGHNPGIPGFTLRHGVHASLEAARRQG